MKDFYKEMYSFHHEMNQKILDYLIEHEEQLSERCHLLISHSILANTVWNNRIEGKPFPSPFDIHPLKDLKSLDDENFKKSMELIDSQDFDTPYRYKNSRGNEYENTVGQILFQVANHYTHHRSQLMSELRSLGITPLGTDYIFVRRKKLN